MLNLKNKNLFQEKSFINGEFVGGQKKIDVFNPANNEKIGQIPDLGTKETKNAIDSAKNAFEKC